MKIDPPRPLNNVDLVHVVTLHVGPLNIGWWGQGRDTVTLLVWAQCGTFIKIIALFFNLIYSILSTKMAHRFNRLILRLYLSKRFWNLSRFLKRGITFLFEYVYAPNFQGLIMKPVCIVCYMQIMFTWKTFREWSHEIHGMHFMSYIHLGLHSSQQ